MRKELVDTCRRELRRQRAELFRGVVQTEAKLAELGEERQREWSEDAVEERMSHLLGLLDARDTDALIEIEEAMRRIDNGTYGTCERCGKKIPLERMRVTPTARLCTGCEQTMEMANLATTEEEEPTSGTTPASLSLLSDEEIQQEICEQVRMDGRIDLEELHISCRNGVVTLAGALPSKREHSLLLQIITDILGFTEVVDHVRVERLAWEREDRHKAQPSRSDQKGPEQDLYGSGDVIESREEVLKEPPMPGEPAPEDE